MENNANLHRDLGGGAPCSPISGETVGIKVTEVVKGAGDSCKNSEPSTISTLVSSSASSNLSASTANALFGDKSDVILETAESVSVQNANVKSSGWSETSSSEQGDQLSNGMGHGLLLAPGNGEGATSKLVNKTTDGDLPSTMEQSNARITDIQTGAVKCESQEQATISPPTSLCPDKTSLTSVKPVGLICCDHVVSEGPPTESDPSPAGESRSFDSLESFSNLNSCPSSDLNSEGMEDRVLAIALQSDEYGADEAKVPCSKDRGAGQSIYHIKWIKWKEENTPIITQNENGPCPLLAIMNVLLLAWKVKMPPMMEIITAEQLMEYLGDYILDAKPKEISEAQRLNYEQKGGGRESLALALALAVALCVRRQLHTPHPHCPPPICPELALLRVVERKGVVVHRKCVLVPGASACPPNPDERADLLALGVMDYFPDTSDFFLICQLSLYSANMSDAMAVLHKLQTGLDVNVKFTGVRVFEYTPECIVFDLLDIPLYHGWLVDPQMDDIVKAVGNCSYNQLVEKIISCKQSENSELAGEGYVAEQFLNSTATQLTYHGLCELTSSVQEGELCVFFRNNHFSTMTKFKGQLYLLVTDQGFLTEEKVVWESLHNVDGDGNFCDSEFRLRPPSDPDTVYRGQQDQIDQDYLMALSLQQEQQGLDLNWEQIPEGISDLELAKKLQEEEDRRASQFYQEQEQAAAAQAQGQQQPAGGDAEVGAGAAAAAVAGPAGAAGATPSPGKQPSTGERKQKKELKDKDNTLASLGQTVKPRSVSNASFVHCKNLKGLCNYSDMEPPPPPPPPPPPQPNMTLLQKQGIQRRTGTPRPGSQAPRANPFGGLDPCHAVPPPPDVHC
ncbi:hypothetical protein JZ751_020599 [Albula glossodonta]|uniref:ubiquitinyl hydrolase 1 n=1 Tax=Albula glossodonta TaxID=121402 RepID=A0A8T2PK50_9TELE|nr:hypothetical protein JZ751_020599 [Albula glossodonta]